MARKRASRALEELYLKRFCLDTHQVTLEGLCFSNVALVLKPGEFDRTLLLSPPHHAGVTLQLRSALCFTLLCPQPRRYTARHEYGEPTECEVRANPRLPRSLLQQRADPGGCAGFLPRFRDHAARLGDARGIAKLSGDLSQPAAGQGTDGALAAERGELRVRVELDQASSARPRRTRALMAVRPT